MLHKKYVNRGFTLVELLAVIVILAIILVIAVPKIMDVINSSKKSTLETSAKMIASAAEKTKMQNTVLGKENEEITCDSVAKLSSSDYENCTIKFDGNTAKVTVKGKGKFEGLSVCNGTKNSATAQEEECPSPFESDSWETIIAAVQSGEYPYKVGDTKEVRLTGFTNTETDSNGLYTLRIANTKPCSEAFPSGTEGKSETACGFVLEFADIITTHNMNSSATNVGEWPASAMRSYLNVVEGKEGSGTIYNSLPIEIMNAIIDTKVVSGYGSTSGEENFTSTDKLYLLSPEEVWSDWSANGSSYDRAKGTSRQLDYYSNLGVSTSNRSGAIKNYNGSANWWWLRSANSYATYDFYSVSNSGGCNDSNAHYSGSGVAPAFRLAS